MPALPHPIMGVGGVREAHDLYFVSPKEYKFAQPVLHCLQACRGVGSVALCSVGFRVRVETEKHFALRIAEYQISTNLLHPILL